MKAGHRTRATAPVPPGAALALDLLEEIEQLRLERRTARYRIDRKPGQSL